jgi:hypothetical protein
MWQEEQPTLSNTFRAGLAAPRLEVIQEVELQVTKLRQIGMSLKLSMRTYRAWVRGN